MTTEDTIPYDEFGRRFVALAVSPERVADTLAAVAGDRIDVGPLQAGPRDAATVTGTGRIAAPVVEPAGGGAWLAYRATLPVTLDLDVVLAGVTHHYAAELGIPLRLTVRTARPLNLLVDITEPRAREITVALRADGVRSKLLRRAGNVDGEVRRHAARFVRERLRGPEAAAATVIELLPLIDEVWTARSR